MFGIAIGYLFATGQDVGLVVEQSLNGLFDSFVLLAVPLFILAANFMNSGTVSDRLLAFCVALVGLPPLAFLLAVNVLFLLLGCLFDATTLLLIAVPLFLPTMRELGVDTVHFGVMITINIMIGLVTPPYGMLLFVINGVTGITLRAIIREIWPFIAVLVVALVAIAAWPQITLAVPGLFGYDGT